MDGVHSVTSWHRWRAVLIALVLLALAARLTFILWQPQAPNTAGDSALYVETAVLYLRSILGACRSVLGAAATCGLARPDDPELRHFYDAHGFDPGASGPVPTAFAPQWLADLSGQRGGLTPMLYALSLWLFGPHLTVLKIVQALLDALTVLAVALLARRTVAMAGAGSGAASMLALLVGLLAALYPPLIVSTGRLLQQPLGTFLVAWGFYALAVALPHPPTPSPHVERGSLRAVSNLRFASPFHIMERGFRGEVGVRSRRAVWAALTLLTLAGFTTAVLRPLALGVAVLAMLLNWWPVERRPLGRAAAWFLLALVILSVALGVLFRGRPYGALAWPPRLLTGLGTTTTESVNLTAYLATDGWHTDEHWIAPFTTPESQPLLDALQADPAAVLGPLLTNVYRLWLYPYNDYAQPFPLPYAAQVTLHQALVLLAVIGLGALLIRATDRQGAEGFHSSPAAGRWPLLWGWLAALYLAGLTLAYAQYHVEARYQAAATPLVMTLAAVGAWRIIERVRRRGGWFRPLLSLAAIMLLALVSAALLLALLEPVLSAQTIVNFRLALHPWLLALSLLFWALLLAGMWGLFTPQMKPWQNAVGVLCLGVFLAVWGGYHLRDSGWRAARIEEARVRQIITLPPDAAARPGDPYLLVEADEGATVRVNGAAITDDLIPWEVALGIPLDGGQYETLLALGADTVTHFPHYRAWAVPPGLLESERIVVEVEGAVWGDALPDEPGVSVISSPRRWDDARSLFLAIWRKDERRIPVRFTWDGVNYRSEFESVSDGWVPAGEGFLYRIYLVWDGGPLRRP